MTAAGYRRALAAAGAIVAETEGWSGGAGELAVQARWFAGEFGREFTGTAGERVVILDFGRWNREAGPDFVAARVRVDGDERRGAIELDLDVRDWERHGHGANPAFRETALHLFIDQPAARFFTRTDEHREVTQVRLPGETRSHGFPPRLLDPITREGERARAILAAAARHRLDRKAAAIRRAAGLRGPDEAWFAAVAVALGYKHNQTPFLLLAQRVGLALASSGSGEGLLFGAAGFLESPQPPGGGDAVMDYLRGLWESWWTERARCERWILPAQAWRLVGVRPANHPHRRVGALARIAASWPEISSALRAPSPGRLSDVLRNLRHPFWDDRFNLEAAPLGRAQALLGPERIRDILLNVYYPLAIDRDPAAWDDFFAQRGPTPAAVMREAAQRYFAGAVDANLKSAYIQQGLLQLDRDFREAPEPARFLEALRSTDALPTT